jgi:GDP-4-dehydro-6-deoxy-D-mannose reductase
MKTVRTRGFNHTGPRQGDVFVTSNFAKQIAEIEKRKKEPVIHVRNLEAKRDFTDVRDIVPAYWRAAEKGEDGEVYNVGTGKAMAMKEMLDILLSLSKAKVKIKVDPAKLRKADIPYLAGSSRKIKSRTGWEPRIPLEKTLQDLLEYWRKKACKTRTKRDDHIGLWDRRTP